MPIAAITVSTALPPPGRNATPSARSMMIATFRAAFMSQIVLRRRKLLVEKSSGRARWRLDPLLAGHHDHADHDHRRDREQCQPRHAGGGRGGHRPVFL